MKYPRKFKYYSIGMYLFSDDNGINWNLKQLTEFTGPKQLEII